MCSRGSLNGNLLIIFYYRELLFPKHSKSDRTLICFRISRYRISRFSQLLGYRHLTKVIAARLLTYYTLVLLEDLWMAISNHFPLYRIVIPKELQRWPKYHLFSLISFISFSIFTFISPIWPNSHQTLISKLSNFSFQTYSCLIFSNVEGFVCFLYFQ